MRQLLIITLLTFLAFVSFGQVDSLPHGLASPKSNTRAEYAYLQADSGIISAKRDTLFQPRFLGTKVLWYNEGVDTAEWQYIGATTGPKWVKVSNGISGGGNILQNLNSVAHVGNTTDQNLLIRADGARMLAVVDTSTNKTASIGISGSDDPQVELFNGVGTGRIKADSLSSLKILNLPDADGVLARAGEINGTTYLADRQGVIHFGNISVGGTTDTSTMNISVFVDSVVIDPPTVHSPGQKVLISDSATGIFIGFEKFTATWDDIHSTWVYTNPFGFAIPTYLSSANSDHPALYRWNGAFWIEGTVYVPNGGFKIGQPMVLSTKDNFPLILRPNNIDALIANEDGSLSFTDPAFNGFTDRNYYARDSATKRLILRTFNKLYVDSNLSSGGAFIRNDTIFVPKITGSSSGSSTVYIVKDTATLDGTQLDVVIPHGLSITPSQVLVDVDNPIGEEFVVRKDNTNITLHYSLGIIGTFIYTIAITPSVVGSP